MYVNDPGYVDGRLRQTVVRLNTGAPVYVESVRAMEVGEGLMVFYKPINISSFGSMRRESIEELDLTSPPLGYTNYDGKSYFLSRYPMRRDWRQGLRRDNLASSTDGKGLRPYTFSSLLPLVIPILKSYPSYKETVERVEDIYTSCAFTRNFALDDRGRIWYKGREVVGKDKEGAPQLLEDFFWLEELLVEEMQDANNATR